MSGPGRRSRSATPSASLTRRSSVRHWSSRSSSARTSASSSSRSSAWPRSSASRRESRDRAAARRSASGESPSYRNWATYPNRRERAKGEGSGVVTSTSRTLRDSMSPISSVSPGNVEDVLEAFADRLQDDPERSELAGHLEKLGGALPLLPQRGALPGLRRGSSSARATHSRNRAANSAAAWSVTIVESLALRRRRPPPTGACSVSSPVQLHGLLVEQVQAHHVGVGQAQHDAVVGVHDLGVHAVALGEPGAPARGPRGVPPGRRRESARPPASRPVRHGTARRRSCGRPGRARTPRAVR